MPHRRRNMTAAERDECVALYRTGSTLDQLAERFDRDPSCIRRLVRRRNANRGFWDRRGRKLTQAHREAISEGKLKYYATGC